MPSVWAQAPVLRIGAAIPMSGSQAQFGEAALAGIKVAVALANKTGGLLGRQVEIVVRDDKGSSVGAVAAGRELASDGVNLFVGALQSPMGLGLAPLLSEFDAVCVGSATALSLTHENFSRNFFRVHPHAMMIYGGLGRVLGQKFPEVKEWASIAFDSEAGRDAVRAIEAGVRATSTAKVNFAAPIFTSPSAADYKVEIGNLMNSNAEGLYMGLLVGSGITFLQQARSIGLTKKLKVIGEGGTDVLIGRAMKKATPDNIWCPGNWYPQSEPFKSNAQSNEIFEQYVAETKDKYPSGLVMIGYRLAAALIAGIKKANSPKTSDVIAALEGITFDTPSGPYSIRKEDHQGHGRAVVGNLGPQDDEPFYNVRNVTLYDETAVLEPPTPGVAFKMGG
jgi:branched-chain amino acid transport system substrate-binding protein